MVRRVSTHRERIEMVRQHEQGSSLKQIAQQMGLNWYTVRHWWRQYRDGGLAALQPRTRYRAQGVLSRFHPLVRYVLLRLKREHPHWGPDLLLYVMRQRPSLNGIALPSRTSIAVYLRPYLWRFRQHRVYTQQRPTTHHWQPKAVHEQWQMDFKAAEVVGPCGKVIPFLVSEGLTSAPLNAVIHPGEVKAGNLTFRDVQADLRQTFTQWGLPDAIRMDRGANFVGSNTLEWPGTLLLWLVGLGVQPLVNHPFRPTQNARVERHGRTWKDHVAVGAQFSSYAAVQAASDAARHARLAHLPSRNRACAGQPPLEAHPELLQPRRPYAIANEAALFDYERVELYLSDWVWLRVVDKTGKLWIADQYVTVGRRYNQHAVAIRYDLEWRCFTVWAQDGSETWIARFQVDSVSPAYIMGQTTQYGRRAPWVVINETGSSSPPS
jgi:hypothetical protein